nr:MAG TPA: hypothetical protein [Caudoviricetes sp.]
MVKYRQSRRAKSPPHERRLAHWRRAKGNAAGKIQRRGAKRCDHLSLTPFPALFPG